MRAPFRGRTLGGTSGRNSLAVGTRLNVELPMTTSLQWNAPRPGRSSPVEHPKFLGSVQSVVECRCPFMPAPHRAGPSSFDRGSLLESASGIVISVDTVTLSLVSTDEEELCTVTCDASFKKGAAGLGVTITWRGKTYTSKEIPRRAIGPVQAELFAIERGLREARKLGASRVLVRSDSKYAVDFSNLEKFAERPHIRKALDGVWGATGEFDECEIEWIPREENRSSDQASKSARKAAEKRELERQEKRLDRINAAMDRAKSIEVRYESGRWAAREKSGGPWFQVDLDDMSCECYHYTEKWSDKSLAARRKHMIPCKHMAAVGQDMNFQFT